MRSAIISDLTQTGAVTITDVVRSIRAGFIEAGDITIWVTEEWLLSDAQNCLLDLFPEKRPRVRLFSDAPSGTANNWREGLGDIEKRIREQEWHRNWRKEQKRIGGFNPACFLTHLEGQRGGPV